MKPETKVKTGGWIWRGPVQACFVASGVAAVSGVEWLVVLPMAILVALVVGVWKP